MASTEAEHVVKAAHGGEAGEEVGQPPKRPTVIPDDDDDDDGFFEAEAPSVEECIAKLNLEPDPAKSKEMKEEGNRYYKEHELEKALGSYSLAIDYCPYKCPKPLPRPRPRQPAREGAGEDEEMKDEQQTDKEEQEAEKENEPGAEYKEDLAVYYNNRAACYVELKRDKEAVEDCDRAIWLKPDYLKAIMRRAQACERLDQLEDALRDYQKVVELDPGNRIARQKIPPLERACKERMEKLKAETMAKLKDLGNSFLSNFGLSVDNFKMQQDPNTGSYSFSFQK